MGNRPYCVGMRNALLRRNVYERSDGVLGIEPQQDPLGNTWTSYIKDWDATKAFDNNVAHLLAAPCRCPTRWRWLASTRTAAVPTGRRS